MLSNCFTSEPVVYRDSPTVVAENKAKATRNTLNRFKHCHTCMIKQQQKIAWCGFKINIVLGFTFYCMTLDLVSRVLFFSPFL